MTHSDRNDFEPSPRLTSTSSPYLVPILACCITAAASLGGVALTHLYDLQGRACTRQNDRFEKIKDLNDRDLQLRKLDAFLAEVRVKDCDVYADATDEREELAKGIQVAGIDKAPTSPTPTPVPDTPSKVAQAPSTPKPAPATEEPVILSGRQVAVAQDTPVVPIQPLPVTSEPPATQAPDLVVRPPPAADNEPPKPFEGAIGQTLTLTTGIDYEIIPLQYYTTTYNVMHGRVMVKLNGKPRFACHSGDSFRLFWKNKPEFVVITYDPVADLKVTDVESGAHLGISTCTDPLG